MRFNPFLPITLLVKEAGISSRVANEIRDQLKTYQEGLIREHYAPTGAQGRNYTLTEITNAGYRVLDALEVRYEKPRGDGSYVHRFYQHLVYEWAVRQGYPARIEDEVDGKRVDVNVSWDNRRVAVEIVIEGLEKELRNLAKDLDRGFQQVVFCAATAATLDELRRKIESELGPEMLQGDTVRFVQVKDFLS